MKKYLHRTSVLFFLVILAQLLSLPTAHGAPGDYLFQWGAQQHFADPSSVTLDGNGNVYVTDTSNVQVFNSAGTRFRKWGSYGSGDGQFSYPVGIALDASGNVYVVDTQNQRIQVFDNAGNFLRKWGSLGEGNGQFVAPRGIVIDGSGNVYVTDPETDRVQVFNRDGMYLRQLGSYGSGDGQFSHPTGMAVDQYSNVYVADEGNARIQVFSSSGNFIKTAVAYTGVEEWDFFVHGNNLAIDLNNNIYVPVFSNGRYGQFLYIFDSAGNKIRELRFSDTYVDEHYWSPIAVAVDPAGNTYTLDGDNDGLRAFDSMGNPLGQWWTYGTGDAQLSYPTGIAVDSGGNVYETDGLDVRAAVSNDRVRVFDSEGKFVRKWTGHIDETSGIAVDGSDNVFVLAHSYVHVFDKSGTFLREWGDGYDLSTYATGGIAVDKSGNVLVADTGNSRIQIFDNTGNFLRQFGSFGTGDGQFYYPEGIASDDIGNILVSDTGNSRVQVFDNAGNFLRKWGSSGFANGQFSRPSGIAVDVNGNVFVADTGNNRIQVFDSLGRFLRTWGSQGDDNAFFNEPRGVAVDRSGAKVYVADAGNNRIQVFEGYGNQLLPAPWASSDIGAVGLAGSAGYQNGTFSLSGSGADIWGTADGFRYVYQPLTGNGQIIARVTSLQNSNALAKGGVMIRENLTANARHALMALVPGGGAVFQRRVTTGGISATTSGPGVTAPAWVKLVRNGNRLSGYVSANGVNWTRVGSDTIKMAETVYIGLAVTSHDNAALFGVNLDSVAVTAKHLRLP